MCFDLSSAESLVILVKIICYFQVDLSELMFLVFDEADEASLYSLC